MSATRTMNGWDVIVIPESPMETGVQGLSKIRARKAHRVIRLDHQDANQVARFDPDAEWARGLCADTKNARMLR